MATDLDIELPGALESYLRQRGRISVQEHVRIERLAGGVSNRTMLVERESGQAWVVKQALAKLRVAVDWFSDPSRIEREALGLKYLAELAPTGAITPLVFEDAGNHLLAMEAVPRPHENWKNVLLAGRGETWQFETFGRLLGMIHRAGWLRRAELAQIFSDRSFFESLRLEPYYLYTAKQVPQAALFFKELVFETRLRVLTLVHGDYSPKNVLIAANRMVLLDHEVIHWGDPAFDLGFALTHFLSKGHHLRTHRDQFLAGAKAYWKAYRAELGALRWSEGLEEYAVRHTLGCMLARVAGRSPLEYLSHDEKAWQQTAVLALMHDPPDSVEELIEAYLRRE